MSDTQTSDVLVFYPGHHGEEVTVTLRNRSRAVRFTGEAPVKAVPAADAGDLLQPSVGGFLRAGRPSELAAVFELDEADIAAFVSGRLVTTAPLGEEIVVVLDRETVNLLKAAALTKSQAASALSASSQGLKAERVQEPLAAEESSPPAEDSPAPKRAGGRGR